MTQTTYSPAEATDVRGMAGWLVRWPQQLARLLPGHRPLLLSFIGLLVALTLPLIVVPLKAWQQGIVAAVLIGLGWGIVRIEQRQARGPNVLSNHVQRVISQWNDISNLIVSDQCLRIGLA